MARKRSAGAPKKSGGEGKDLKKQITIRIDANSINYFKRLASETGIKYQNLINLYLRECAHTKKMPSVKWN
jgi:uncharacterized protein (DUF4415 family)